MDNISVSVIVPIYNVEKYLDECLRSLEKQTLKNIEVILVNDGSTDQSRNIAQKYVERNDWFQIIDQENKGLSAARNVGIEHAKGKYLYFIDSDDYLENIALEELHQKAEDEELEVLKFCAYTFYEDKAEEKSWMEYRYEGSYPEVYSGIGLLQRMKSNEDIFPSCCLMLILRELVQKNHLRFFEGILYEDNLFHWKLLVMSRHTAILNKPLYYRRIRYGSITQATNYFEKWRGLVICANEANKYLRQHKELQKTGIERYYFDMLISGMRDGYLLMDKKLRHTKKVRQLRKKEKKILYDLRYGNSLRVFFYTIHPIFYVLYGEIERLKKKVCTMNRHG